MIIRAITRTSKKGIDQYTVYLWDGSCLCLSANPDSPQGVSQWGEFFGINDSDFELGRMGDETLINWFDLPVIVQAHIEKRIRDAEED